MAYWAPNLQDPHVRWMYYRSFQGRKKSNVWFSQSEREVVEEGQDTNMVTFTPGPVVPSQKSLGILLGRNSLSSAKS